MIFIAGTMTMSPAIIGDFARDVAAMRDKVHFEMPWIKEFFSKYVGHMQASTVQIFDIVGDPRPLPQI